MLRGLQYFAASILVVVLFMAARDDLSNLRGTSTDTTYYTTQLAELTRLEKEMLQFRVQASGIAQNALWASRDEMLLAFDVLWSRVNTEYMRRDTDRVETLRKYEPTLRRLSEHLKEADNLVQTLQPGDLATWSRIESILSPDAADVAAMTTDSYAELYKKSTDTSLLVRKAVEGANHLGQVYLIVAFAIVLLLMFELRRSEKLNVKLAQREVEISRLAEQDSLTELRNRRYFDGRMKAIESGIWTGNLHLILVDLDGFKTVNDTHGHAAGDHLLKAFARRLTMVSGHEALVARLGGDEFAVVIEGSRSDAMSLADGIVAAAAEPIEFGGETLRFGASIGVSTYRAAAAASSTMLREADLALYESKERGRGRALHFAELRRERVVRAFLPPQPRTA